MRKILVISGPTAVGKTKYAIEAAKALNGEIVSCDSMQLYKYMDIGSAKPTLEEQAEVKHYLVDQIDPQCKFSVAEYQKLAKEAIESIYENGKLPVIEGGTGLYLNSLIYNMDFSNAPKDENFRNELEKEALEKGPEYIHDKLKKLDPEAASRIHPNNVKKVIRAIEGASSGNKIGDFSSCVEKTKDFDVVMIGLTRDRDELYERIGLRVDQMVEEGLFEEVKGLLNRGLKESDISMKGIGYKEVIAYFNNSLSKEESVELIKKNTRHLAKKQLTWFRRYDDMKWFDISNYENESDCIEDMLKYIRERI